MRPCTDKGEGKLIKDPCPECRGTGLIRSKKTLSIKIPAGVESGNRLKLSGEGEAGANGAPPGDLYVVISVSEHPIFQRDGQNVVCEVPISLPQAALGCEIDVPTLDGKVLMPKIPAGTQGGKILKPPARGSRYCRGTGAATSWWWSASGVYGPESRVTSVPETWVTGFTG